ncbi:MAG: P-loop NTPase fold protein [Desulfomicrobium apsheronum]|nr:P-loop NTPase fold protein [Desulfomicrobium apsheronum]
MKIVTPPLFVEDGDSFQNDILDRESFGEALLNLVVRSNDALVISLDGKWGEGKTTFVKMWQGLLSESDIPNIYIDAFSIDYVDDAFISVVSSILSYAEDSVVNEHRDKVVELKEKSKQIGCKLLSWTTRIAVKVATLGIVKNSDIDELIEIKNDLSKTASDFVGDFVEERILEHSKDIELIVSFREILSEIPSKLQKDCKKPLVVIVDELDRCKPTFAVEMLEKIKHLFSVKNVVFVLVMNKMQLEESIKSVYGVNVDAHTYLQKFINIEAKLPIKIESGRICNIRKYAKRLIDLHEIETWGDSSNIVDNIDIIGNHFKLSLRQLEKVFTIISIFYATRSKQHLRIVPYVTFLSVIKVVDPQMFDDILYQRVSYGYICEKLRLPNIQDVSENDRPLHWFLQWLRYGLLSDIEFEGLSTDDNVRNLGSSISAYHVGRKQLVPMLALQLSMFAVV